MKYLCLTFNDEAALHAISPHEADALVRNLREHDEALRASGHLLAAARLEAAWTATVVRVRNGRVVTTDPGAPAGRAHLDGFYLIEARDLNEAISVASRIPAARFGLVEVRPVAELTRR